MISTGANKLHALRYLLIQLLLQVLHRPGEFSEAVSELVICCKKAFGASDLLDLGEDELDSDANPELMDVLVDTMLSLLPQSSAPMRSAIDQVCAIMASLVSMFVFLHGCCIYISLTLIFALELCTFFDTLIE